MSKDSLVGSRIREYQVVEVLGEGGMGTVYRARHVYLDEDRAIKIIHARLAGDTTFIDRFIREAKILTKLRHPNLVQLHEFGTLKDDTFFMVMELIQGESVHQRIKRIERITVEQTIKIIRESARGLHSAHQRGIVHRDISPDNLVLCKDLDGNEITKVIDFGIAKPLFETSSQRSTVTNLFIGKPEYCSPEQCGMLEETEMIDVRSDVYSLGVTMYHMVAGKLPFYSRTPQGYLLKHVSEIPRPASTLLPFERIPEALDRVILKMIAKKREERHGSMEELIRDLDSIVSSETAATGGISKPIAPHASERNVGELFANRYLIEKKLGEGGMGTVYKAIDKILEVPVAVKIMSSSIVQDEKTIERFKREVILARKVAHPNACRIFDMGESSGIHYVSMEFLEGRSLAEIFKTDGRLTLQSGIPILRQVLVALQEAHRVGVVHRDLKPQNIMVDPNWKAHIMDFGISISVDTHRITQTGALMGTPHYMAPEQFEGKNIDHRADIYAIGVIMFEMFTSRLPYDAETPVGMIYAHLKLDPLKPSAIVPNFSAALEKIILKTLQKDPMQRQQTVRELLVDLQPFSAPTTSVSVMGRAQIAHKLIAEQSYSKAIKYLNSLVKVEPQNPEWTKLLNFAATERVNREIQKARSLIRKKNLIQAQLLMEKIDQHKPISTRVNSMIRKLQNRLSHEKEQAANHHIQEAQTHMEQRAWSLALASLESAWNLKPDESRITHLQKEIQTYQQKELEENLFKQVNQARSLFEDGRAGDGLMLLEDVLKDSSEFEPALALRIEIDAFLSGQAEHEAIRQRIEPAFQSLRDNDLSQCAAVLENLSSEDLQENSRTELRRIHAAIHSIAEAFRNGSYESVHKIIQELVSHDPFGWLKPHVGLFQSIMDTAEKKQNADLLSRIAAVSNRVDTEAEKEDGKDQYAVSERERVSAQFLFIFEKGKAFFESSRWEEAILAFQDALRLIPDSTIEDWIAAAQDRMRSQERVKTYPQPLLLAAIPVILLLLGVGVWWIFREKQLPSLPAAPAASALVPVSINAVPWARIKITPISDKIKVPSIPQEELTTPCSLMLPPGDYALDLENGISRLRVDSVVVNSSASNSFKFQMPKYNPEEIVDAIGGKP